MRAAREVPTGRIDQDSWWRALPALVLRLGRGVRPSGVQDAALETVLLFAN
jgi:hypothetical protein